MNKAPRLLLAVALGLALPSACGEPQPSPTLGTNSNWFVACHDDGECRGAGSCECARCTRTCSTDADCSPLGEARCAAAGDASALSQCVSEAAPTGICLPSCAPGGCGDGEACIQGSCVSDAVPEGEFCAPAASAAPSDRKLEDELSELVLAMRAAGGVTCGSSRASAPASVTLRVAGSLRCAARLFAADLDANGGHGLVDSTGQNTQQRLQAAGYTPNLWAESFALGSSSANDALAVMLADQSSCPGLVRDGYTDLGVAHVGRAYVVTLASE